MEEINIRLDEINFRHVFRSVLRNLWVVVLIACGSLMCLSSYQKLLYNPTYQSTATIVVSAKGDYSAYNSLSLTQEMAQVFSEIFQSNILRERVESQLGEPLNGYITTTTINETNLMAVSVVSDSPEKAFRALNLFIECYPSISDYLYSNAVLEVIKKPVIPLSPNNSIDDIPYEKNTVLISGSAALLVVIILSVLRDTVQTPRAARRRLDGRLLRCINHEEKNKTLRAKLKRKKTSVLITNPLISARFRDDNQSLCYALEYHMRKRSQKVVLISSTGENEGKSTVAANLALSLAARKKKVLLLDCDFRKPAIHKIFNIPVSKENDFITFLSDPSADTYSPVHISKHKIYAGVNMNGSSSARRLISSAKLKEYIRRSRDTMDYIVIDSPPIRASADAEKLSSITDVSVLVVRENFMLTRDINDCIDTLRSNDADFAGYVLNNCLSWSEQ